MSIRYLWFKYIVLISTTRKGNTFIPPLKGVGFLCFPYPSMLNQSRTGVVLNDTLSNKIANTPQDAQSVLLLVNLMDLQVGPDMAISTFLHLHLQDQHIKIIPASPSSPS